MTLDSETKKYFNCELLNHKNKPYKINGIKTEKFMILKYLRQMDTNNNMYFNTPPGFYYNGFPYSFFVNPNKGETNIDDGKYTFAGVLQRYGF